MFENVFQIKEHDNIMKAVKENCKISTFMSELLEGKNTWHDMICTIVHFPSGYEVKNKKFTISWDGKYKRLEQWAFSFYK